MRLTNDRCIKPDYFCATICYAYYHRQKGIHLIPMILLTYTTEVAEAPTFTVWVHRWYKIHISHHLRVYFMQITKQEKLS